MHACMPQSTLVTLVMQATLVMCDSVDRRKSMVITISVAVKCYYCVSDLRSATYLK